MLRTGEVDDAKSIDDLITSASTTGKSIPDFENLDFNIARRARKILTGNFKKHVTTAEGKAQSEKRPRMGGQIASVIYDFFRMIARAYQATGNRGQPETFIGRILFVDMMNEMYFGPGMHNSNTRHHVRPVFMAFIGPGSDPWWQFVKK